MFRTIKFLIDQFRNRLSAADAFWRDLDSQETFWSDIDRETAARKTRYIEAIPAFIPNGAAAGAWSGKGSPNKVPPTMVFPRLNICFRPVMIDGEQELILVGITDETGTPISTADIAAEYGAEWSADGEYEELSITFRN